MAPADAARVRLLQIARAGLLWTGAEHAESMRPVTPWEARRQAYHRGAEHDEWLEVLAEGQRIRAEDQARAIERINEIAPDLQGA